MRRSEAAARDGAIARAVAAWFIREARDLPWRVMPRDPYLSLVSEFMLQQTQVSRVLEKFGPFVARFPGVRNLAAAKEDEVLSMWSGMGYYRRAKNLHAAAKVIVRGGGQVPEQVDELMELPGVGRYTAGSIASIAFGKPVPIVDGNVARVLMRIDGKDFAHASKEGMAWAWERAEELVGVSRNVAALNEGLMELGAVVCAPKAPRCEACPVRGLCKAAHQKRQGEIPRPKAAIRRERMFCEVVVVKDGRGRVLVEKRSDSGMWAGLWQAPTWEREDRPAREKEVGRWAGASQVKLIERFGHQTTHREVRFAVWSADTVRGLGGNRVFATPRRLAALALSNPQRRILLGRENPE